MGILSKNDLIDADLLTRYGLLNRKLLAYQPQAQEIGDLRSLLNRLDCLERDLLLSIPGVGTETAWVMIVVLGTRQFDSAPQVASFLGLNPIEKQSGMTRYRRPRLSKAGSGHFRQALFFPAMVATRKNPDIKAQNERR